MRVLFTASGAVALPQMPEYATTADADAAVAGAGAAAIAAEAGANAPLRLQQHWILQLLQL